MNLDALIRKYDVPVPRYTSYPTVPCWDEKSFTEAGWIEAVRRSFNETNASKGISLYVHLPFCESLCTYCACNTRITKNHAVEEKYIDAVVAEWESYKARFDAAPVIRELHLGGGTPTFFSPQNILDLIQRLLSGCVVHEDREFSFEGHPNNTTRDHLQVLFDLGFRRVSFGVQDLDARVQRAINRVQPLENLRSVTSMAREIGYESVSFDLIYGLPYQTLTTVSNTITEVIGLKPDRIAFYSYAHVPWIKPGQRGYEDADLPSDVVKRSLYEEGQRLFLKAGYEDIGMDHFSLESDSLAKAHREGRLHRNFMGYTTNQTDLLLGLGVSSISDAKYAYSQNVKKVEDYYARIASTGSAVFKGHIQTEEDRKLREAILDIVCRGRIDLNHLTIALDAKSGIALQQMQNEGILIIEDGLLQVTTSGRAFIRNIAAIFDKRMQMVRDREAPIFSKAI